MIYFIDVKSNDDNNYLEIYTQQKLLSHTGQHLKEIKEAVCNGTHIVLALRRLKQGLGSTVFLEIRSKILPQNSNQIKTINKINWELKLNTQTKRILKLFKEEISYGNEKYDK